MKILDVHLNDQLVGSLWQEATGLAFRYAKTYLETPSPLPLSRHLPIPFTAPERIFSDLESRAFFENLLPEGEVRTQLARALGISRGNTFSLLEAVGGDCAGAVSVLSQGEVPARSGERRSISAQELAAELEHLPAHPFLADEEGVRLSLAGAQNKLPVCFDGRDFYIPTGSTPSTHIIKTPIHGLENTVVNEAFCMNLAQQLGLNVPQARVTEIAGRQFYLVERYDRQLAPSRATLRLHQEDFCQALGIPPEQKYEKEGGPGLKDCFELVRNWSSEPLPDAAAMLSWCIFNLLIGNADAHGKNVAFLYTAGEVRLAPFYDLISTAVYERVDNKFAMRLGGEKDPRYLLPHHLERFAAEAGIGLRAVKSELRSMVERIESQAAPLAENYRQQFGPPIILDRLMHVIAQRIAKARTLLS
jgi:serine/threonine-protein kinase HipA